ncbi:hypothetical protein BKA70DRAFT_1334678 [Coprinopsis sp. MPI-PUGE-AT-0042]|nr:hypothetical protein BKA70DRAFT_1334678 [Coprinopsis sp. MPI-PUGE-AT-0042]
MSEGAIPTEILSDIFQQSLPQRLDRKGRLAFQVIRSVCSRWRSVSLASPILWSSLSITCERDDQSYRHGAINLLDGWFSRAGPYIPLELEYVHPQATPMQVENLVAMKMVIRRHQTRWRWLSLFIYSVDLWDVFFDPSPSEWINLHTLKLWTYDLMAMLEEQNRQGLDALEKIPSLRCLMLEHDDGYEFTKHVGPIDLAELHVNLDTFHIAEAQLISAYSNLTKLVLVAGSYCSFILLPNYNLTLSSLTSFFFDAYNLSLLHHLTTPALVDFEIHLHSEEVEPQKEFLAEFIARCTSALQSLTLNGNEGFIAKVIPSLVTRPSLTLFTVNIWPSTLDSNTYLKEVEKEWCPRLRDLTISIGLGGAVELERMKGLVTFLSRREDFGLRELERLTVNRCSGAVEFPYELFRDVRLGKLRVMIPWSMD